MANHKQNNVRILQSTQKKNLHPAVYAVWCFFSGAAFISAAVLLYINLNHQTVSTTALQQDFNSDETVALTHSQTASSNQIIPPPALVTPQAANTEEFTSTSAQQFDGDLLNAFKHEKVEKPNAQQLAPFESIQPQIRPAAAVQSEPAAEKKKITASDEAIENLLKQNAAKNTSALQAAVIEPEIPSPRGSVQITVTKRLQAMKDPAAAP